ncbi:transcriptional regulator, TetR family [Trujillonella endophytica]|uniref:Transcriptional regulator, TetR family n=1 Tax=Trujillonella endophytica TaxID=673521 RepID=A0A1H8VGQ4_9ACTN|nr:transcriptional regulator, TetR family [Trujillella endophytica]
MNRTRLALLRGAAAAFADTGLRATTMQAVAAAAGVAKATLYNHFRTKDDVVRALLSAELARLAVESAALVPEEALVLLADAVADHPVLRTMARTDPADLAELLGAGAERWSAGTGTLAEVLDTDADTAETIARWLLGLVFQPADPPARRRQARRLALLLHPPG